MDSPFDDLEGTPTKLSANGQYSYMSMWALMAAPHFYSGDITRLDYVMYTWKKQADGRITFVQNP